MGRCLETAPVFLQEVHMNFVGNVALSLFGISRFFLLFHIFLLLLLLFVFPLRSTGGPKGGGGGAFQFFFKSKNRARACMYECTVCGGRGGGGRCARVSFALTW